MIVYPNAKINLGLHIVEKRPDGYHNIETIFFPVGWKDILELVPDEQNDSGVTLTMSGIPVPGETGSNLVEKAYALIAKDYPMPAVKVHLHKQVPTGAGLGGGSSDAAFFIRALNELFELNLSWGELHHYAKQLGADCSFFIINKPMLGEGKGDELEPVRLDLKGKFIAIVHPGIHVSTAEAYAGVKPQRPPEKLEDLITRPLAEWKSLLKNEFEASVFAKHPEIAALKEKMYSLGAEYAAMSGSGSAVFGIFEKQTAVESQFPGFRYWQGRLD
jgi:4-diphosphocytidyl-2-C-methyl-D-erythritol kinase